MSKEVILAGALAGALLILVAVAFIAPHRPKQEEPVKTAEATTDPSAPDADPSASLTHPNASGGFTGVTGSSGFTGGTSGLSSLPSSATPPAVAANGSAGSFTAGSSTSYTAGATSAFGTAGATTFGSSGLPTTSSGTTHVHDAGSHEPATNVPSDLTSDTTLTSEPHTHIVATNETLGEISQKYYNTTRNWKKIVEANPGLDPNALRVGQKLVIPVVKPSASSATAATTVVTGPGESSYTVQKDDSYYKIAQKELGNASRWKEIETLNDIAPEELHVGQVLKIPSRESASATHGVPDSETAPSGGKIHTVASGETLSDISKRYYGTTTHWRDIVKANPNVDPGSLRVGQKLAIPDLKGSSASSTAPLGEPSLDGSEYTVQKGDSIYTIAEKQIGAKSGWKRIVDANPGIDPRHLRVGQKLKLPTMSTDDTRPVHPESGHSFAPLTPAPTPLGTSTAGGLSSTAGGFTASGSGFSPAPSAPSHGGTPDAPSSGFTGSAGTSTAGATPSPTAPTTPGVGP